MSFIASELRELEDKVKDTAFTELVTCHPSMVQIRVRCVALNIGSTIAHAL